MHGFGALALTALLVGCASRDVLRGEWRVTYYDRNRDGIVDYELHMLGRGHAYADWALIDTRFRGCYDLRVHWGVTLEKQAIDIPVPMHPKITAGKPPMRYTLSR